MKKLPFVLLLLLALAWAMPSCHSDDTTTYAEAYAEWKAKNDAWLLEQQARTNPDGTPYFKNLVPAWNPASFVMIHYFNDRALTENNLSPLYTSTVDTRYYLTYYEGTPIDSSYLLTSNGPGIFRTTLNSVIENSVIEGWAVALQDMRCGDTCEVLIPYDLGYGVSSSTILPYSALKFNISLIDIPYYETNPNN